MTSNEPPLRPGGALSPETRRTLATLARLDELERVIEDQGGATRCDTSLVRAVVAELLSDDGASAPAGESATPAADTEHLLELARTRIAQLHVTLGVDDHVVAHLRPMLHRAVTQVFYLGAGTDTATE